MSVKKQILVTGATGLVGSHVAAFLIKSGYKVVCLVRNSQNLGCLQTTLKNHVTPEQVSNQLVITKGDILNIHELIDAVQNCDIVVHAAAVVSFYETDAKNMESINIQGTKNVVNACLEVGGPKLFFVSSTAAIGKAKNNNLCNEETKWIKTSKTSYYAVTKLAAEMEVWRGFEEGLKGCIVNPGIVIGPGNWGKSSTSLFTEVNKGLRFYTSGINGFVYVNDIANCLIQLIENQIINERFILVSENLKYKEVFTQIANALGKKPPTIYVGKFILQILWRLTWLSEKLFGFKFPVTKETAISSTQQVFYDSSKIKNALQFQFTPIKTAISNTAKVFAQKT